MLLDCLVNVVHQADGLGEGSDDVLVVLQVVVGEDAALTVFEPFLADLIAADGELPYFRRHAFKVLSVVDVDAALLGTVLARPKWVDPEASRW